MFRTCFASFSSALFFLSASCAFLSSAYAADVFLTETFALGTLVTAQFKVDNKEEAARCYNIMNKETRRLEYLLSAYDRDSDVTKIAQNAGRWIEVSPETFEILNTSKTIAENTKGAFDPTVGNLVKLWSVDQPNHRVPQPAEISKSLEFVDYKKIQTKTENGKYYAKIGSDQGISLGAIGKGYIADKVLGTLNRNGCKDVLLSFGGNIIGSGTNGSDRPWTIGLQRPDKERGEFFATVPLDNTSIVTSGDYEKFFIQDGVKYNHILDPKTGKPVPATLSSVTVIEPISAHADALCTALFVMGWDKAVDYLKKHPDIKAVLVDENVKKAAVTQNAEHLVNIVDPSLEKIIISKSVPEEKSP